MGETLTGRITSCPISHFESSSHAKKIEEFLHRDPSMFDTGKSIEKSLTLRISGFRQQEAL
jgi:hypothetical protein